MADAWTVVVTREPEWDDIQRGRAEALTAYEWGMCQCGCGLPMQVAHDKTSQFYVGDYTCYAGKAKAQTERAWRDRHKNDKGEVPPELTEGFHHYVTVATPELVHQVQQSKQQKVAKKRRKGGRGGH